MTKQVINVTTCDDVEFGKFRWWSNWIDVAVYNFECTPFLLQMSVSRTNSKKFKSTRMTGSIVYRQASTCTIGDLTQLRKVND